MVGLPAAGLPAGGVLSLPLALSLLAGLPGLPASPFLSDLASRLLLGSGAPAAFATKRFNSDALFPPLCFTTADSAVKAVPLNCT